MTLKNKDDQSADAHVQLIEYVLGLYKYSTSKIVAAFVENCGNAVARQIGCQFMGCGSQRLNIAVKDIITEHCPLINDMKTIMSMLCFPVYKAELSKLTDLVPVEGKKTHGSSVKAILEHYVESRE